MSAEDLEHLLSSPGWTLFEAHVTNEWGAGGIAFRQQLDKALDLTDNDAAASQARQIRSGQKVIMALLRWPSDELTRLKKHGDISDDNVVVMSRRGAL